MTCNEGSQARTRTGRPHKWSLALACGLAAASVFVLFPGQASAQQWLFTPEIELAAHHVDNPRLDEEGDADAITGGLVDAGLAFRRNTQTSSVLLRPRVALYRYTDAPDEDSEAYFLDFNANRETQRSAWRIGANYRQQQVFRGETTSADFSDIGVDDDVQTGTGRTFVRRQRDLWSLSPGATFELSQLTSLEVDLGYLDVRYDSEELGEAVDYNNSRADVFLVRALSAHSDIGIGVFASRYDPQRVDRETDSAGARVRYQQEISDISGFSVDIGVQESQTPSFADPASEISETSFLWNVGYDRQLEVTRWRFDIGRQVTPSGSGTLVERDLYRAVMYRQLKPRWNLQLSGVVMNTDSVAQEDLITSNARDYIQGRASLAYQVTRNWTVEGLYSFTHQDFEDIPGDAQEHELRLSFVYSPPLPTQ